MAVSSRIYGKQQAKKTNKHERRISLQNMLLIQSKSSEMPSQSNDMETPAVRSICLLKRQLFIWKSLKTLHMLCQCNTRHSSHMLETFFRLTQNVSSVPKPNFRHEVTRGKLDCERSIWTMIVLEWFGFPLTNRNNRQLLSSMEIAPDRRSEGMIFASNGGK